MHAGGGWGGREVGLVAYRLHGNTVNSREVRRVKKLYLLPKLHCFFPKHHPVFLTYSTPSTSICLNHFPPLSPQAICFPPRYTHEDDSDFLKQEGIFSLFMNFIKISSHF